MDSSRCGCGSQYHVLAVSGQERTLTMLLRLRQGLRLSCSLKSRLPRNQLPSQPPLAALHVLVQSETFESSCSVSFEDRCVTCLAWPYSATYFFRLETCRRQLRAHTSHVELCPQSEKSNPLHPGRHTSSKLRPTSICPGEMQLIRTPVPAKDNRKRTGYQRRNRRGDFIPLRIATPAFTTPRAA